MPHALSNHDVSTSPQASELLLDCIATFTCTELASYNQFIFYAVVTNILHLERTKLKKKLVDGAFASRVQCLPLSPARPKHTPTDRPTHTHTHTYNTHTYQLTTTNRTPNEQAPRWSRSCGRCRCWGGCSRASTTATTAASCTRSSTSRRTSPATGACVGCMRLEAACRWLHCPPTTPASTSTETPPRSIPPYINLQVHLPARAHPGAGAARAGLLPVPRVVQERAPRLHGRGLRRLHRLPRQVRKRQRVAGIVVFDGDGGFAGPLNETVGHNPHTITISRPDPHPSTTINLPIGSSPASSPRAGSRPRSTRWAAWWRPPGPTPRTRSTRFVCLILLTVCGCGWGGWWGPQLTRA